MVFIRKSLRSYVLIKEFEMHYKLAERFASKWLVRHLLLVELRHN